MKAFNGSNIDLMFSIWLQHQQYYVLTQGNQLLVSPVNFINPYLPVNMELISLL